MKPFYDTIYLSPHLDDAALSCGGMIWSDTAVNQSNLIITVMAGDPPQATHSDYVASLHQRWNLNADAVAVRRQEDATACHILGADYWHWDVPDCIYRHHPGNGQPFYVSDADIFGRIHPQETGLVERLSRLIAALPAHDRLIVPLTAGHHVDHQLVRLAAERSSRPDRLVYYEDYPYVRDEAALTAVIPTSSDDWQAQVIPLAATAVAAKIEAVAAFQSQLSTFFNGRADLAAQISNYVQKVGGERLWYRLTNVQTAN
ncbi:MAG: PIG-L family deacetylase [Ardenticatenaceae bacterium]|nr:PIG-L family deacetylase [Ardenticatenaceae bacterium]MCB9444598.1 PIG-L family deacetylase [Ardenticatenaceae bacterium]